MSKQSLVELKLDIRERLELSLCVTVIVYITRKFKKTLLLSKKKFNVQ